MPTLDWIGKKAVENHHKVVPYRLLKCVPELPVGEPGSGITTVVHTYDWDAAQRLSRAQVTPGPGRFSLAPRALPGEGCGHGQTGRSRRLRVSPPRRLAGESAVQRKREKWTFSLRETRQYSIAETGKPSLTCRLEMELRTCSRMKAGLRTPCRVKAALRTEEPELIAFASRGRPPCRRRRSRWECSAGCDCRRRRRTPGSRGPGPCNA